MDRSIESVKVWTVSNIDWLRYCTGLEHVQKPCAEGDWTSLAFNIWFFQNGGYLLAKLIDGILHHSQKLNYGDSEYFSTRIKTWEYVFNEFVGSQCFREQFST